MRDISLQQLDTLIMTTAWIDINDDLPEPFDVCGLLVSALVLAYHKHTECLYLVNVYASDNRGPIFRCSRTGASVDITHWKFIGEVPSSY